MRHHQPKAHFDRTAPVQQFDRMEWARMAQAAYSSGRNDVGHRFSAASAHASDRMELKQHDSLMAEYRAWLVFGEWPSL